MTDLNKSAEQQARDMLERMGVPDAQRYSAGDLVELANLIALSQPTPKPSDADAIIALAKAEAALADIGDAEREPGDDLAWCERRAAEALPCVRAVLARLGQGNA